MLKHISRRMREVVRRNIRPESVAGPLFCAGWNACVNGILSEFDKIDSEDGGENKGESAGENR